jgi:hypothetical protein
MQGEHGNCEKQRQAHACSTSTSGHDTSRHAAAYWPRCKSRQPHEHARRTGTHATQIPIVGGIREGRGCCRWRAMEARHRVQKSCCQVLTSTAPTSPAPPPSSNAPMCRHGKLRPRHPLPHRDHAHHPFLVAAGKTKPGSKGKSAVSARPPQKRAPVESAFMAASTESVSRSWPSRCAPVGRAAPASLQRHALPSC